nr:replication initiator protein A [uncultured Blautia sp.]
MADFEYFRAEESDQFSFFRIPKALFTEKEFASLSTDAKLLYGILLDRISLSKKNGWIDGDGYVYIIYTIASAVMAGVRSSVTTTESSRRNLPKDSRKRPRGGVRYL